MRFVEADAGEEDVADAPAETADDSALNEGLRSTASKIDSVDTTTLELRPEKALPSLPDSMSGEWSADSDVEASDASEAELIDLEVPSGALLELPSISVMLSTFEISCSEV